jgi:predicted ATP-binding protein involved in virulence
MQFFIKQIQVNQILHLSGFTIHLGDSPRHLLITGQNGSGKTQLVKAIAKHLQLVCNDKSANRLTIENQILSYKSAINDAMPELQKRQYQQAIDDLEGQKNLYFGKVVIEFNNPMAMTDAYDKNDFILAYYETFRNPKFEEVHSIEKPDLTKPNDLSRNKVGQFLKFLADNKVQAALARNEGKDQDAENINNWFNSFRDVLRNLFNDSKLELEFDYTDYSFYINSVGKKFKFTQLSAGYAAALDIVADLILRMQKPGSLVRAYDKPGIVLIDEPETHLHLALQRQIMPILTKLFPNVQFVVATHSPFILSSLPNAVAYDLEHREELTDLTEYSYGVLAEGYFGVDMASGDLSARISRLETLVAKENLESAESEELKLLFKDLETVSEAAAPAIKGRIMEQKRKYLSKGAK